MFYLEKCAVNNCNRSGNVALVVGDAVCNIHKDRQKKVEVELKGQDEDEEEE